MIKNILGWKTNKKIIVFESDDWGSFRFKNKSIRDKYIKQYDPKLWMHYNDCFESYDDLCALEETLKSFKDIDGNHPSFTFLMNPANPDFEKIKQSNFKSYHYEKFDETLSKREDGSQIFDWYKKSIKENLIELGFHGREHLNVNAWMKDLQKNDKITHSGFKNKIWGEGVLLSKTKKSYRYRSTFQIKDYKEIESLKKSASDGIKIMNEIFDYEVSYFLAPDGPYHLDINPTLKEHGIKYIGLRKLHRNPLEDKWHQKKYFWMGKSTKEGLKVITRNVIFEPNSPKHSDWVSTALNNIDKAFKFKNPAVICTHRANFVSGLNENNKINGLKQLNTLISKIVEKWPDVKFMTSSSLGDLISK